MMMRPNRPAVQAAFIEERIRPLAAGQTHLVLAGDFNFVESPRDRACSEGPLEWRDRTPAAAMAALVEDSPLRDAYRLIHPMQRGYTFSAYNAQARLDRLYVSMALVPRVLGCDAGESGGSDHRVVAMHLSPLVPESRGPGRPRVRAHFWADRDLADGFRAWFGREAAGAPTHGHAELMRWWQAFKPRLAREARRLDCDLGRRRDAVSVEVTRLRADLQRARAAVEAGRDGLAELAGLYALQRRLDAAVRRYAPAPPACVRPGERVSGGMAAAFRKPAAAAAGAGGTPPGFLDGVVASIYKAKNAADAANYRPLTMLGSDYRILVKVLATRWTPLLSAVVGPEQTAFLAGRRISDNICLTQMLPGLLAANAADGVGPTGAALALLDFRKAYDTIDRGFLIAVMEAVGVGDGVLAWTRTILTHTYASAEVNGFISAPRKYAAGVRQGCPAAPALFLFLGHALACFLRTCPAVFAGLRGLEAAVPTLWRMPLLNARKEPIWRLWDEPLAPPSGYDEGMQGGEGMSALARQHAAMHEVAMRQADAMRADARRNHAATETRLSGLETALGGLGSGYGRMNAEVIRLGLGLTAMEERTAGHEALVREDTKARQVQYSRDLASRASKDELGAHAAAQQRDTAALRDEIRQAAGMGPTGNVRAAIIAERRETRCNRMFKVIIPQRVTDRPLELADKLHTWLIRPELLGKPPPAAGPLVFEDAWVLQPKGGETSSQEGTKAAFVVASPLLARWVHSRLAAVSAAGVSISVERTPAQQQAWLPLKALFAQAMQEGRKVWATAIAAGDGGLQDCFI
ncbi:hypothetical protein FOA52_015802 [Chlamydomonas sp. UWO 241]|nr:hypothetical protein FOA52_015802 [Chlamydomonas sp. UWO 241]